MNSAAIEAIVDRELALNAQERDPDNLQLNIVYNGIKEGLEYLADISQGELEFFEHAHPYGRRIGLRSSSTYYEELPRSLDRPGTGGKPLPLERKFYVAFLLTDDGYVRHALDDRVCCRYAPPPAASGFGRLMHILHTKPDFNPDTEIEKALVSITRQAESRLYVAGLNRPKQSNELKPAAAA